MKTTIKKISVLLLAFVFQSAFGQTVTGSFTQIPCNNDGIYSVSTTGLTPPITYTYSGFSGGPIVHANVNSTTDQLTNIPLEEYGYIYVQATNGSTNAYTQASYTTPFSFSTQGIPAACPATMGTVSATQTSGTAGPFSFLWENIQTLATYPGNNISVPFGSYSLQVTDLSSGCVLNKSDSALYVYQISNVSGAVTVTPASCNTGSATAVGSGGTPPYTYLWSNGSTTPTLTGLSLGYYSLTITDAIGCQSNGLGANIQQNPQISVNFTASNATCVQSDGSAIAFGSGGIAPYTYAWSNGQTGNTASNLTGGNSYTVIVTDANGCIGQGSTLINSSTPITVNFSSTPSQCTSATGSATLTATGGTAPYTYYWNIDPTLNVKLAALAFRLTI